MCEWEEEEKKNFNFPFMETSWLRAFWQVDHEKIMAKVFPPPSKLHLAPFWENYPLS